MVKTRNRLFKKKKRRNNVKTKRKKYIKKKTRFYLGGSTPYNECSICKDHIYTVPLRNPPVQVKELYNCLQCNTPFHKECIDKWCSMNNNSNCTCPICRINVTTKSTTTKIDKWGSFFSNSPRTPANYGSDDY
jgi:hypothetical protein